ncbi:MAG: ABC transporter substrate-binding protein [Aggregatilineaceae bacterium]
MSGSSLCRRLGHFLLAVVLLAASAMPPAHAQGDPFPRTVIDGMGRAVTVPARPALVAVVGDDPVLTHLVEGEALRALPVPPLDALPWDGIGLLVIPDLYATAYPALVESARVAGVPVFVTTPLASLDVYRAHVIALGRATGRDDRAAALLARLDRRMAALRVRLDNVPPVRALVLTPERYTFGQGALITDLIAAAGGVNVAAEVGYGDIRQLTDAALRALAPQVILLTPAWTAQPDAAPPDLPGARLVALPFGPTQPPDPAAALLALALALHPAEIFPALWPCARY